MMTENSCGYRCHLSLKGSRQTQLRVRMCSFLLLVLQGEESLSFTKQKAFGVAALKELLLWAMTSVGNDNCGIKPLCATALGSSSLSVPVWHCIEVALLKERTKKPQDEGIHWVPVGIIFLCNM